jgi:hypothetical protein
MALSGCLIQRDTGYLQVTGIPTLAFEQMAENAKEERFYMGDFVWKVMNLEKYCFLKIVDAAIHNWDRQLTLPFGGVSVGNVRFSCSQLRTRKKHKYVQLLYILININYTKP